VPEVLLDEPLEQALGTHHSALAILLWEDPAAPVLLGALLREGPIPDAVTLVIGPEGGFTPDEVEAAREAGYRLAGLGPLTLRSETAAVAALGLVRLAAI
jgi:16S rRNA (uracil1498-N3)-methyltransferase